MCYYSIYLDYTQHPHDAAYDLNHYVAHTTIR